MQCISSYSDTTGAAYIFYKIEKRKKTKKNKNKEKKSKEKKKKENEKRKVEETNCRAPPQGMWQTFI